MNEKPQKGPPWPKALELPALKEPMLPKADPNREVPPAAFEAAVVRNGSEYLVVLRERIGSRVVERILKTTEDRRIAADRIALAILEVRL